MQPRLMLIIGEAILRAMARIGQAMKEHQHSKSCNGPRNRHFGNARPDHVGVAPLFREKLTDYRDRPAGWLHERLLERRNIRWL